MKTEELIAELLSSLNYWEQNYGTAYQEDPMRKGTGEENSRIESLKESLKEQGAIFHWNGREYVLDKIDLDRR